MKPKPTTNRVTRVACSYKPDVGLTVWPIEADTYEEAAEGGWPCGYIHKVKRYGSIALFSAYLGAEDVWREFEEDLQEDGFLKARRWLVRRVREALKSRDRSKPAKSESQ